MGYPACRHCRRRITDARRPICAPHATWPVLTSGSMVVLFAIPRVVGWLAHWRQMMLNPSASGRIVPVLTVAAGVKIWRPRQLYVGAGKRDYVPVEQREDKNPDDPKAHPSTVGHATSMRTMAASYKNKIERQSRL